MAELFIAALLGHLIGDFLLQPKHMALSKGQPGRTNAIICTIHVFIYTSAIALMLFTLDPVVLILVFVPHWLIDRYSLGHAWLKIIKGRTFEAAYYSRDRHRDFDIAFTSIVYTVIDSTLHLLSLWLVIKFIIL